MTSPAPLLVIAAGGTGGHMYPAQALAEAMLSRGWRVRLSTDARGKRYSSGFPESVPVDEVKSATFARASRGAKFIVPIKILAGVLKAWAAMRRDRPAVVVGFGGYPSIPALLAARLMRLPRMIHEQNGVLGRVNAFLASRVHKVACGTWPTKLPRRVKGIIVGNPVRSDVMALSGATYREPGPRPMSILIFGGSQGAQIISEYVPKAVAGLPAAIRANLSVSHQARIEDLEKVKETYEKAAVFADVQEFFDDIPKRMAASQLVISRAGASSVAEIGVIGRPSILIPYAAATEDHQSANALPFEEAGAAEVIPEDLVTSESIRIAIEKVLTDPDRARSMAAAARQLGQPGATEHLAALVEELSGHART